MQTVGPVAGTFHHTSGHRYMAHVREPEMVGGTIHHDYVLDYDVVQAHQVNAAIICDVGAESHPGCRISVIAVPLVTIHREVAERDIRSSGWCRRTGIKRRGRVRRAVVNGVVVGARFDEESSAAA